MTDSQISVYSNPVTDRLQIRLENKSLDFSAVDIISADGKIIKSFTDLGCKTELDVHDLNKSLYILNIKTSDQIIKKSFIKC